MKARQAHRFHQCRAVRRRKWRFALSGGRRCNLAIVRRFAFRRMRRGTRWVCQRAMAEGFVGRDLSRRGDGDGVLVARTLAGSRRC